MAAPKTPQDKATKEAQDGATPAPDIKSLVAAQARDTLYVLFAWRLINALCVRTFFQPDEYFQALEPAWSLAFGHDSGAWITWEWRHGLRSSLHPAIFSVAYFLVENALETTMVKATWLFVAPKMLQCAFAALGDWYTWRLAEKLYGPSSVPAWSTLLMTMLNPWQWYTSTRTFSNCLESTLTIVALHYWPWEVLGAKNDEEAGSVLKTWSQVNDLRLSLAFGAMAILLRPTNALIWFAIGTLLLTRFLLDGKATLNARTLLILIRESVLCGSFTLGLSLLADRLFYGEWIFTAYNLIHVNLAQDIAVFYGQNDWHYYLSQGLPLLCTTILPFILVALHKFSSSAPSSFPVTTSNALRALTFAVLTTIAALSCISHKEVRFITPLLPILHVLAAPYVTQFFTTAMDADAVASCPPPPTRYRKLFPLVAGIVVNMVVGSYLATFHSSAPISVTSFLRHEFERVHPGDLEIHAPAASSSSSSTVTQNHNKKEGGAEQEIFALFLTPCHATPWRSHLVYPNLHAQALACEPPIDTAPGSEDRLAYRDETARFYDDPVGSLRVQLDAWSSLPPGRDNDDNGVMSFPILTPTMPRYLVAYEGLSDTLLEVLGEHGVYYGSSSDGVVVEEGKEKEKEEDVPGNGEGDAKLAKSRRGQLTEVWRSGWNGLFTDDDRKAGRIVVWDTGAYGA